MKFHACVKGDESVFSFNTCTILIHASSVNEKGNNQRRMESSIIPLYLEVSQRVKKHLRCWLGYLFIDTREWKFIYYHLDHRRFDFEIVSINRKKINTPLDDL